MRLTDSPYFPILLKFSTVLGIFMLFLDKINLKLCKKLQN